MVWFTIMLMGLLLLVVVGVAEGSPEPAKSLSLPIITQPIQIETSLSDPCNACHDDVIQPKRLLSSEVTRQVDQLGVAILQFNQISGGRFKADARFQAILEAYWQAWSDPQGAAWLVAQASDLLTILANEARSGYWRASRVWQCTWTLINNHAPLPPLLISRLLLLILVMMPICCLFKAEYPNIRLFARLVQHRGPPSEAAWLDCWSFFLDGECRLRACSLRFCCPAMELVALSQSASIWSRNALGGFPKAKGLC